MRRVLNLNMSTDSIGQVPKKIKRRSKSQDRDGRYDDIDLEVGHVPNNDYWSKKKKAKDRKRELESKYGSIRASVSERENATFSENRHFATGKTHDNPNNRGRNKSHSEIHPNAKLNFDGENSITINDLQMSRNKPRSPKRRPWDRNNSGNGGVFGKARVDIPENKRTPNKRVNMSSSFAQDSISLNSSGETSHRRNKTKTGRKTQKFDKSLTLTQLDKSRSMDLPRIKKPGCLERQESRIMDLSRSTNSELTRGRSSEPRRGLHSQQSKRLGRQRSQSRDMLKMSRTASSARPPLRRGQSMDLSTTSFSDASVTLHRQGSRWHEMNRSRSLDPVRNYPRATRGNSLQRYRSTNQSLAGFSMASTRGSRGDTRASMTRSQSVSLGHGSTEIYYDEHGRRFVRNKNGTEGTQPKTLVLIWIIVVAELGFDLATTIIALRSFVRDRITCCGQHIELMWGKISLGMTIPFFGLVMVELLTLIRIIILTLWPSVSPNDDNDDDNPRKLVREKHLGRRCCFCLKMNSKVLMGFLNYLVLLNPIFGCMIAWMLMYQSDKKESFIVLGLEGAALILHFASVCLEGSFRTCKQIMLHSTPLIPFLVSVGMVGFYIKQGGVCYNAEEKIFKFTGCEICNVDGILGPCPKNSGLGLGLGLGTSGDIQSFQDLGDIITNRTDQYTYCSAEVNFCFFNYTAGLVQNVNSDYSIKF